MANKTDAALNHLVDDLCAGHGENLVSILLYGSVAAGDHIELRSNHNLLIVLKQIPALGVRVVAWRNHTTLRLRVRARSRDGTRTRSPLRR